MTQSPDYPELQYVAANGDGSIDSGLHRSQTQVVVMHATDNTASDENEAGYASWRPDQTSAHFYNDEDSIIQAVRVDNIAYGCFSIGNGRSVQFEMVGKSNAISDATMRRAAPYVAKVCQRYGIPIRKVGPADMVAGAKGICGHGDVTNAWHQGDHTDPGSSFPWDTFIGYVAAAAGTVVVPIGGGTTPIPSGRPQLQQGSQGDWVRIAQGLLWGNGNYPTGGIDGDFGGGTRQATINFQNAVGILADGIIGPVTWSHLIGSLPTVQQGSSGLAVRKVQALLYAHGFDPKGVDGGFGPNTRAAVIAFQQFKHIGVDGIVGPESWGRFIPAS